jgi:hypothetical protein
LCKICFINKIKFIHAWCTPAGSIGYMISKLTRIPLIIDSYEPHAESMVENHTWKRAGIAFKILFFFEKLQTKHAKNIIATTRGMEQYALTKFHSKINNFYVKPACVDFNKFYYDEFHRTALRKKFHLSGKVVCVYAGKIGGIYFENEVFDFLKIAHNFWKDQFKVIMLTNTSKEKVFQLATSSDLETDIIDVKYVGHEEIPKYLLMSDFAINPVKPVPTKLYCTSIKDGEYWAMGLPIIISKNISDDSKIIEENNVGCILNNFTSSDYLDAVLKMDSLLKSNRNQLNKKIQAIALKYRNFSIAETIYKKIYTSDV